MEISLVRQRSANVEMLNKFAEMMQNLEENLRDTGNNRLLRSHDNMKEQLAQIFDRTVLDEVHTADRLAVLQTTVTTLVSEAEEGFLQMERRMPANGDGSARESAIREMEEALVEARKEGEALRAQLAQSQRETSRSANEAEVASREAQEALEAGDALRTRLAETSAARDLALEQLQGSARNGARKVRELEAELLRAREVGEALRAEVGVLQDTMSDQHKSAVEECKAHDRLIEIEAALRDENSALQIRLKEREAVMRDDDRLNDVDALMRETALRDENSALQIRLKEMEAQVAILVSEAEEGCVQMERLMAANEDGSALRAEVAVLQNTVSDQHKSAVEECKERDRLVEVEAALRDENSALQIKIAGATKILQAALVEARKDGTALTLAQSQQETPTCRDLLQSANEVEVALREAREEGDALRTRLAETSAARDLYIAARDRAMEQLQGSARNAARKARELET